MKYFFLSILCCLLSGCGKEDGAPSRDSSIEHAHSSGCIRTNQMFPEEVHAWNNPSDWSEENIYERIKSAEKAQHWKKALCIHRYYASKGNLEESRCWLIKTRELLKAVPPEDAMRTAIPKIDALVTDLDERISFYKTREEEVLEKYLQSAENGDLASAEKLYIYYEYHHQFDQAIYWIGKVRDLMIQRAGNTELAQQHFQKWFDNLEDKLSKKAVAQQEKTADDEENKPFAEEDVPQKQIIP
jgi:hypothetical protein